MSHVRIAADERHLGANRISQGETDTLIGCDLIVSGSAECLKTLAVGRTKAAVCSDLVPTAEFARNPEWDADAPHLLAQITGQVDAETFFNAPALAWASRLLGDSIAANMFMLGVAWQRGWIPVSLMSLMQAIELNGVQIKQTKEAFEWGRRAAVDRERVALTVNTVRPELVEGSLPAKASTGSARAVIDKSAPIQWHSRQSQSLAELIAHRVALLVDYGGASKGPLLAKRYQALIAKVSGLQGASDKLIRAVATQYFRLLAVKDEWEVARLYAAPEFEAQLKETFEGQCGVDYKLHFHLGAWPFAKRDPVTGHPLKAELGPWVLRLFKGVAKLRGLRGSLFDPFRRSEERVLADRLLAQYESDIALVLVKLNADNVHAAIQLASLPEKIRGYGHVRATAAKLVNAERLSCLQVFL